MVNKFSLDIESAKAMLPVRPEESNKGTFGRVLVIAGSLNMVGCCSLAVGGALRSGAGLVELAFPDCIYNPLASRLTENLFLPLKSTPTGFIDKGALPDIISAANKADVIVFGCGIGMSEGMRLIAETLLLKSKKPIIIDADGLNAIADDVSVLEWASCDVLLTPHPGEMARLCSRDISYVLADRERVAVDFCAQHHVNLLLKGHNTLICNKNADTICINNTGNSGLAKGGAGDLLSGIIGGLTPGVGYDLYKAACLGAFIHGMSADLLKYELTEYSMLPGDCLNALPEVFKKLL